jgi:hypothetical protein
VLFRVIHGPSLRDLGRGHLKLGAALASACAGSREAIMGSLDDQVMLELCRGSSMWKNNRPPGVVVSIP